MTRHFCIIALILDLRMCPKSVRREPTQGAANLSQAARHGDGSLSELLLATKTSDNDKRTKDSPGRATMGLGCKRMSPAVSVGLGREDHCQPAVSYVSPEVML